ncbi:MAG: hypothetical protein H0W88_07935 [Parachlamydiaceae bacterium]|nr:hypothetical protein [Parachlamydiaceae bacterium]
MQFCLPIIGLPLLGIEEYRCYKDRKKEDSRTLESCERQIVNLKTLLDNESLPYLLSIVETISALFLATMFPVISTNVCLILFGQTVLTGLLLLKNEKLVVKTEKKLIEVFKNNLKTYLDEIKQIFTEHGNEIYDENFCLLTLQKRAELIDPLLNIVKNKIPKIFPKGMEFSASYDIFRKYPHLQFTEKSYYDGKESKTTRYDQLEIESHVLISHLNRLKFPSDHSSFKSKHDDPIKWKEYIQKIQNKLKEERLQNEMLLFIKEVDLTPPVNAK